MIRAALLLFALAVYAHDIATPDENGYVRVPGGVLSHHSCVHEVPSGSHLENRGKDGFYVNGVLTSRCPHPNIYDSPRHAQKETKFYDSSLPANGWQAWTQFAHPGNSTFTTFNGYFTVPGNPSEWHNDGVVFIFTGLQAEVEIIQPVIQYGAAFNGGGAYWGGASWYVSDLGSYYSQEVNINAGDKIYGVMQKEGGDTWRIDTVTPQYNTSLTITSPDISNEPYAFCTLEVYTINSCNELPPSNTQSKFTGMYLKDPNGSITPQWYAAPGGPNHSNSCGSYFSVNSPSAVDCHMTS